MTRVYSSAPLTLPSHASILTAVSPPVHGLRANGLFRLGPKLPTLATVLKAAGYRTGAFVGAFVLDARFGLNRGFDIYDDRYGEKPVDDPAEGAERRAEEVVKPATAWILREADARGLGIGATGLELQAPSAQLPDLAPRSGRLDHSSQHLAPRSPGSPGSTCTTRTSRIGRRSPTPRSMSLTTRRWRTPMR